MIVTAVQGTWGWEGGWWEDGSRLWAYLAPFGIRPARVGDLPFVWSTDLGGTWQFWRRWFGGEPRWSDWEAGGYALAYFLRHAPESERVVLSHSHGGQVALHAAALGARIDRLITVSTPVRADMAGTVAKARPHIGEWWHVCDLEHDRTAWWGAFGDGHVGNKREFRDADHNIRIAGIGHSGLLEDPKLFPLWQKRGLIDFLRGTVPEQAVG